MLRTALIATAMVAAATAIPAAPLLDLSDETYVHETADAIIDHVNSINTTWTAGRSTRWNGERWGTLKHMCGTFLEGGPELKPRPVTEEDIAVAADPPASFDPRTKWPMCPSLNEIRDQAACGSCWAHGAVEAQTDRTCIASNGVNTPHLSAQDMNSCCSSCGMGCGGGYPAAAWQYWVDTGVVTGANYGVKPTLCDPYSIPTCDHHLAKPVITPCGAEGPTPACKRSCVNGDTWASDTHKGSSVYSVEVTSAMNELMTHGPVEASFTVYADFPTYTGGVYQQTSNQALGGHAVKIIGWGEENGTPYWLVANSWNPDWGLKGFFKIVRGKNECGIESSLVAGLP